MQERGHEILYFLKYVLYIALKVVGRARTHLTRIKFLNNFVCIHIFDQGRNFAGLHSKKLNYKLQLN